MGSIAGAALGGGMSLLGGMMSGSAEKDAMEAAAAAAQFNPYNVYGAGGSVNFDGGAAQMSHDAQNLAMRNQLFGLAGGQMGALDPTALANITRAGLGAQAAGAPGVNAGTQEFLDQSRAGDAQMRGLFDAYAGQMNPLAGNAMSFMPMAQQAAMQAFGPGVADPIANFAAGRGAELLGQDFRDVQASELARMRAQAQPGNERAVDSTLTNLFTSGRLGNTGGANIVGRLAEAQNQQDLGFQGASTQTAQNLLNANRNLGQNLLGMGQQGLLGGQAGNTSFANMMGNLGMGGNQQAANLYGNIFAGGQGTLGALDNRALQRISGAQNLFGFGNQITSQGFNQAQQSLQSTQNQDAALRALAGLGGNLGGQQAQAGANQARYLSQTGISPIGAGLMGFGGSLFGGALENFNWNPPKAGDGT